MTTSQLPNQLKRTAPLTTGPLRYDYHERLRLAPHQTLAVSTRVTTADRPRAHRRAGEADAGTGSATPFAQDIQSAHARAQAPVAAIASGGKLNLVLVGLQLIVGYQWLVSGVDKLLDGTFPDKLGSITETLASNDSGRLPNFFVQFLQQIVVPNASNFGVAVELGETLAGLGLLTGACLTMLDRLLDARLRGPSASFYRNTSRVVWLLAVAAALATVGMGINYFLLDGMPQPWFKPGFAFGGAIDSGLFLAMAGTVIFIGQLTTRRRALAQARLG